MNRPSKLYKKIVLSLVLCCAVATPSQAIRFDLFDRAVRNNPQAIPAFYSCNKWLALTKGIHCGGEAIRTSCMESEDEKVLQSAALVSAVTAAILIGTKAFAAYKQKDFYTAEPALWTYPIASIGKNVFELVKSIQIAQNAKTIAYNNKRRDNGKKNSAKEMLLSLLAAETGTALWSHLKIHGTQRQIIATALAIAFGLQAGGLKLLSNILWAARHIYESKHLNTSQFATDIESFENEDTVEEKENEDAWYENLENDNTNLEAW